MHLMSPCINVAMKAVINKSVSQETFNSGSEELSKKYPILRSIIKILPNGKAFYKFTAYNDVYWQYIENEDPENNQTEAFMIKVTQLEKSLVYKKKN